MYNTNHVITVSKYYSCYTSTVMAPMKKIQDQKRTSAAKKESDQPPVTESGTSPTLSVLPDPLITRSKQIYSVGVQPQA